VRVQKVNSDSPWIQLKWPGVRRLIPNELTTVKYIAANHTRPSRRWTRSPRGRWVRTTAPSISANVAAMACNATSGDTARFTLLYNGVINLCNAVIVTRVPAVKTHTADLAARLVDEAGRLLGREGAAALTLRRLATASGTSTMAVYTLYGDKQGLLRAMYRAGFERLGAALRAAADGPDDPLEALVALGHAYRDTALANPHLYDLMFGAAVPGFVPDEDAKAVAEAAYQPLVDGVARCLETGQFGGTPAERIALHLWSVSHGMVSLELAGHLPATDPGAAYVEAMVYAGLPFVASA
jgi:AcrR family transcriptional regulator